jgi:hypothetical protein
MPDLQLGFRVDQLAPGAPQRLGRIINLSTLTVLYEYGHDDKSDDNTPQTILPPDDGALCALFRGPLPT